MCYRQADTAGDICFFMVNLAERRADILVRHIDDLRAAIKKVKDAYPFAILAMVVLTEHLHAIWRLPPGDADYPLCWSLIKAGFLRWLAKGEHIRASRRAEVKCWASFHSAQPSCRALKTVSTGLASAESKSS